MTAEMPSLGDNRTLIFYGLLLAGFLIGFGLAIFIEESKPGDKFEIVPSRSIEDRIKSLEDCRKNQMEPLGAKVNDLETRLSAVENK